MTAKEYIDSLSPQDFQKIEVFSKESADFYKFLAEPCEDVVTVASFAMQCQSIGIPTEYTNTADALHYLVVAIDARSNGNA
jgi:hypothetical protein